MLAHGSLYITCQQIVTNCTGPTAGPALCRLLAAYRLAGLACLYRSPMSSKTIPVTAPAPAQSAPRPTLGMLLGLVGVAMFALSLPMNRVAASELDPVWVALARAMIATALAALILVVTRCPRPPKAVWRQLALAASCVVFGFPVLTSLAMAETTASAGAIIIALLPLATVIAATTLGQQRPSGLFWVCALAGAALVVGFSATTSGVLEGLSDVYLWLAVVAGGFGYAWGGIAATRIGGWQTICWTVIVAAPVSVPLALFWTLNTPPGQASTQAWFAVLYLGVASQLVGFFFFYGGMAVGGVARVSQVQLLQLFLTIAFAHLFLGETVSLWFWLTAAAVVLLVAVSRLAPVTTIPVRTRE